MLREQIHRHKIIGYHEVFEELEFLDFMNPMQGNAAMSFVPPIQGDASEELWVC